MQEESLKGPRAFGVSTRTNEDELLDAAMSRYASGDDSAFGEVYARLGKRLVPFLAARTRDRGRAEDLFQQTMLNIHRARQAFNGMSAATWAFAIARRLLIDEHRRRLRDVTLRAEQGVDDHVRSSEADADAVAIARQTAVVLDARMRSLPESQRIAFDLVRGRGLSLAQAAELLGTTPLAVKLRAHRASNALRAVVVQDGDDIGQEGRLRVA